MFLRKIVKFKKLNKEAVLPKFATPGANCFDFTSTEAITLDPWQTRIIPTGLSVELPKGHELQVRPRSGLTVGTPFKVQFGTIDEDYRGEIGIMVFNACSDRATIQVGTRIAQGAVRKAEQVKIVEVQELSNTERGGSGFGSTGV